MKISNVCYSLILLSLFSVSTIAQVVATPVPTPTPAQLPAQAPSVAQQEETKEAQAAEPEAPKEYEFSIKFNHDATSVKDQGSTGTCWCFASASFLESELLRENKGEHNISEMFIVKNIYMDKAFNYVHRNGKTNFSEGALAHDFIRAASRHGLVPEEVYDGLDEGVIRHSHGEMAAALKGMLDGLLKQRKLSRKWPIAFSRVVDTYLGDHPVEFTYQGKTYTPKSFAESIGFNEDDYIGVTSFSHHPFNRSCVLEIPDNFSSGSFQNVPIDQLVSMIDTALERGYTVAWDGDISESGFNRTSGLAILPADASRPDAFKFPGPEIEVTQEMRQATFEDHTLTDDHLMHLTGMATDQNGTKYYIIKNSWGEVGNRDGYLYMSETFVRAKTIAITVHKDSVAVEPVKPQAAK